MFFAAINAKIKKDWRIYTNADNFFFLNNITFDNLNEFLNVQENHSSSSIRVVSDAIAL